MKKKNILVVHNYYRIQGGEDIVVSNEIDLLRKNGHKVVLYSRTNDEIISSGLVSKLVLFFQSIFSLKTYTEIKEIIRKEQIDIVHVHNTLSLISPSVYYAAIHSKIPVVQTLHNFRLLCPNATFTKKGEICEKCVEKNLICSIKHKCYRNSFVQTCALSAILVFHRLIGTYQRVDAYISLTEFSKEKFINLIPANKIYIKPNFTSIEIDDSELPNKYSFLYLGRIDQLKGIDILLQAFSELPYINLKIVGTGPYEEEVKKYLEENSLKNIDFLGYKNKTEIGSIINNSIALIVPSQCYEGFPMTIVESLSLGVPVICGDIGNIGRIIKDNQTGLLFKYNDYLDLKDKIITLNSSLSLQEKLSVEAKNDFKNNYTEEKNYKELIKIYNLVSDAYEKN